MARILKLIIEGCVIECVVCDNEREVEDYVKDVNANAWEDRGSKHNCFSCIEEIKQTTDLDVDSMDIQEYILKN